MIFLLSGSDSFRIQQKLNKYKEKFLRQVDSTGINIETLENGTVTVDSFRKAVLSGGLFVKKRLIIIKNIFQTNKDKNLFDEIENYLKQHQEDLDTILIFVEIAADTKNTTHNKIYELLQKQKFSENFEPLVGVKLIDWIKKETAERGGKISGPAVQFLAQNLGSDLWQMSSEIDKLIALKNNEEIQIEDVKQFVKTKLDENIFNLTDAFGRKDKALALKLVSDQLEAGAAWGYLLSMFARQIKIIFQIKSSLESGTPQYQLAKSTGLHPFVVQKTVPQTLLFSLPELKKIYSCLLEIDLNLKSSQNNPEVLFDLLVTNDARYT